MKGNKNGKGEKWGEQKRGDKDKKGRKKALKNATFHV